MAHEVNRLTHLTINEISLVDRPANAETDASGQRVNRAMIAIYKRDAPSKEKKMGLKRVLKSDVSRAQLCAAVREKAVKIAKKRDISIDEAEARVWSKNPELMAKYESAARPAVAKIEKRFAEQTQAEATIDDFTPEDEADR
jgi:hypothetical protein